jgi:hypothetical protein
VRRDRANAPYTACHALACAGGCCSLVPARDQRSCVQEDITGTPFGQICLLILAGVAIHVVYLAINTTAAKALRLTAKDFKAVVFMASQKTLPISVAVISFLGARFGRQGMLTIPCIIGHLSQLFIDAVIASRMASAEEERLEAAKLDPADTPADEVSLLECVASAIATSGHPCGHHAHALHLQASGVKAGDVGVSVAPVDTCGATAQPQGSDSSEPTPTTAHAHSASTTSAAARSDVATGAL